MREGERRVLNLVAKIVKLFKKDFQLLANYERSHRHFLWFLVIDALLSAGIVIGGFALFAQMNSDPQQFSRVGAVVNTSQEIVTRIADENLDAYWLGDIPGFEYTLNHRGLAIVEIFYWRQGSFNIKGKQFVYRVKTYKDERAWESTVHVLITTANRRTLQISKKIFITMDKSSMNRVIVRFANLPEIVTLLYPLPQSLQAIEENVQSLRPIK